MKSLRQQVIRHLEHIEDRATPNLTGQLLVAAPDYDHDLFGQSVCVVVHQSARTVTGLFLNHLYTEGESVLWEQLTDHKPRQAYLGHGGNASGPVVAIHNQQQYAEFAAAEKVFLTGRVSDMHKLLAKDSVAQVRILVGQQQWKPVSIFTEIIRGNWLLLPVGYQTVFSDTSQMWNQAIRRYGDHVTSSLVGARGLPKDSLCN